jgi:hypothetical protein
MIDGNATDFDKEASHTTLKHHLCASWSWLQNLRECRLVEENVEAM